MSLFDRLLPFNPFAKYFKNVKEHEREVEDQAIRNSQGLGELETQYMSLYGSQQRNENDPVGGGMVYTGVMWEQYFGNKAARIAKYREMSFFPEISDAIDMICDEAVVPDSTGKTLELEIREEIPRHIEEQILDIWNYLITDVFEFDNKGWELFRKWLIDAEIYIELVLNNEGNNIVDFKVLPPHTMMPIYQDSKITGYVQTLEAMALTPNMQTVDKPMTITFDRDQVVYANYGLGSINDVRGYLESAIRTYNQLKNLEDSLVIYRLVRAPERRVWNIAVGRMPKGKAEEYIKGLIQRYKKRIIYDPETGAMSSTQNVQALTEDFWFAKNEAGEGTTVETIGGGMNLGELEDINYFLQKLYKTLKLPRSRWDDSAGTMYSSGKSGEILREEIKFARFVERLQQRFAYIILEPFLTLLKFRGIDERYIREDLFKVKFTSSNLFKEYKEMELNESRFALLASINDFIYDKENNPKGYFAPEFVIKDIIMFSEQMWEKNLAMLEKLKGGTQESGVQGQTSDEFGGMGGFGEFGGGGGFGGELGGGVPELGGGETPPEGGAGGAEAVPAPETGGGGGAIAPESIQYKTTLIESWLSEDKKICNKYMKG